MPDAESAPGTALRAAAAVLRACTASRAVLASLLLHAAVGFGLWHLERLPASEREVPTPRLIELRLASVIPTNPPPPVLPELPFPLPETPPEAPAPAEAAPADDTATESSSARSNAGDAATAPSPASAPRGAPEDSVRLGEAADDTPDAAPDSASEAAADAAQSTEAPIERAALLPADTDVEAVRRDAVARALARLRQAERISARSGDDSPATAEDADPFGSAEAFFEAARTAARRGGVLAPRRQRTRFMRSVARLCNELTGGFGILGIVNVCADPGARADLFGHLRPEYMESVPLCTAEEELDIEISQTGTGAVGELKCVLVPASVRADYYGRYDPELAGWLPAEADAAATVEP